MSVTGANPDRTALLEEAGIWCVRLAEDDLDTDLRVAFDKWLSNSPAHVQAFDDVARTWNGIDELRLEPDILDLRAQALRRFKLAHHQRWVPARRRWQIAGLAAAMICLMFVVSLSWFMSRPTIYNTGIGERRIVQLEDGSRIWMDAATRLAVDYHGGHRDLVLFAGRAKFGVAKDPLRPFAVTANNRVIVATGTAFSVELLGQEVRVILYEGHVTVLAKKASGLLSAKVPASKSGTLPAIDLVPGRELVASAQSPPRIVAAEDPARSLAWENGQLSFDNVPLNEAVERVNRYSHSKVAVGNPRTGELLVNGLYRAGDTDAFVDGVTGVLPVRVELRNGVQTFVR
jgi:transmembrane sensor